ncbi:MAG: ABC transporter permease [Rugosibacter sp.]|nr:ABC transporter permease [Rugosibacter sp.]
MKIWRHQHSQALLAALRRLSKAPLITLLSFLAIGVALALPTGGQLLLENARQLLNSTSATPQISIFMKTSARREASDAVRAKLKNHPNVAKSQFLPRETTLARMKTNTGLREVVEALPDNPFPDAVIVTARDDSPIALESLAKEFRQWPDVAHVQLDSAWVKRLEAFLRLGRDAMGLLSALLAAGLIAITFTITRMQTLTHRAEIEVSQLLGATAGFIRRPFLYFGALLGLGGGITAWLLVAAATFWLQVPLGDLLQLYDISFVLQPLQLYDTAILLSASTALGWLGALLSLGQHLHHPSA